MAAKSIDSLATTVLSAAATCGAYIVITHLDEGPIDDGKGWSLNTLLDAEDVLSGRRLKRPAPVPVGASVVCPGIPDCAPPTAVRRALLGSTGAILGEHNGHSTDEIRPRPMLVFEAEPLDFLPARDAA